MDVMVVLFLWTMAWQLAHRGTRIGQVFEGRPYPAFIAVPAVPHRFAVEPATGDALRQLETYSRRHPPRHAPRDVEILSPGFNLAGVFVPAGDGARSFYLAPVPAVTAVVRVRRDGLISSARDEVEDVGSRRLIERRRHAGWQLEDARPAPHFDGGV
jgi:hypothetical protein